MTMEPGYRHTQTGTVIIASITGVALLGFVVLLGAPAPQQGVGALVLLGTALGLALFWSLTVEVGGGAVTCSFGVGLIRKRIPLSEIRAVQAVRHPWYGGWGIRWLPGRYYIWNVSGFDAVELELESGRRFRIGTDEPDALMRAIQDAKSMKWT